MRRRHLYTTLLAAAAAALAGCADDEPQGLSRFSINASIEAFADGSKTHLDDERWIYWDLADSISVGSDRTTGGLPATGELMYGTNPDFDSFNAVFVAPLPMGSRYFLGLHPCRQANRIRPAAAASPDFERVLIDLPDVQPIDNDTSFANDVLPMVAWYGGQWTSASTAFNLNFHPLAGIVRLQLFSSATDTAGRTIASVRVDADKPIAGLFAVRDYKTFEPYLVPQDGGTSNTLHLRPADGYPMPVGDLHTLYLVLPARGSRTHTEPYTLTVTVADDQGRTISFGGAGAVPVRRCGITYASAVNLDDWTTNASHSTIAGNGTQARPFKIYSVADLCHVRDCINASAPINGQPLTAATHYSIMRSDIELDATNWTAPIARFRGHLGYAASGSASTTPGLTNNSGLPLFDTIDAGAVVSGLKVRLSALPATLAGTVAYTPFCALNRGTIDGCELVGLGTLAHTSAALPLAGLCAVNEGSVVASGANAAFALGAGAAMAGVCRTNRGTVSGCYLRGTVGGGARVGGIVLDNEGGGTVADCYFAARVTAAPAVLGCIVATNLGTVANSYAGSTARVDAATEAAGVAHTNAGLVDHCWVEAPVMRAASLAGIVHYNNGGTVANCWCSALATLVGTTACYALVADGGSAGNCYSLVPQYTLPLAPASTATANCYRLTSASAAALDGTAYTDRAALLLALDSAATANADWRAWHRVGSAWPTLN